jgi:hypothetical protein
MNDLDNLLQSWNKRNEPSEVHLDKLRHQAIARLSSSPARAELQIHSPTISKRRGNLAVVFAFAASILMALGIFKLTALFDKQTSSDPLRLVAASTHDSQSLFAELDRMFDGRWQSLSEIDGHVQLQTSETNGASSEPGVAVRLTVLKRQSQKADWTIVWDASIISHTGEWVQLPQDQTGGDSISVWSYALPDGSVIVESDLALTNPVSIQLTEPSIVNRPSQPTQLWSERRADGEFQLIQSVARLEANRG